MIGGAVNILSRIKDARVVVEAAPAYVPMTTLLPLDTRCILNDTAGHVANYLGVIARPKLWGALESAFYGNGPTRYAPTVIRAGVWARAVIDARRTNGCCVGVTCVDELVRAQLPRIAGLFGLHQRLLATTVDFLMDARLVVERYKAPGTVYVISGTACAPESFIKGLVAECVYSELPMILHKLKPPSGQVESVDDDVVVWRR